MPRTSTIAWCIMAGVPLLKLPHPATNIVSPVNTSGGSPSTW